MPEGFENRAKLRRSTMTVKVARSREEREAFERERESLLLPHERAEAIWGLVTELMALRGSDGSELRLDRSFARLERRGR